MYDSRLKAHGMAIIEASLTAAMRSVKAILFHIGVNSKIQKYITDICGLARYSKTTSLFAMQLWGTDLTNVH